MRLSRLLALICLSMCILTLVDISFAQSPPDVEVGLLPYRTYDSGEIDSVNLMNGNLDLHIPIASYPQRGRLNLGYALNYNDKNWSVIEHCTIQTQPCSLQWAYNLGGGVSGLQLVSDGLIQVSFAPVIPKQGSTIIFTAQTSDGGSHMMFPSNSGGFVSLDGSGIWYNGVTAATGGLARSSDGSSFLTQTDPLYLGKDTNGNTIDYSRLAFATQTDTLGRSWPSLPPTTPAPDLTGCIQPLAPAQIASAAILSLPGQNGGSLQIKVCSANYTFLFSSGSLTTIDTNDFVDTITDGNSGVVTQIVSIVIYNGSSWSTSPAWGFNYTSFGSLSQVTFPTGGTIAYQWSGIQACSTRRELTPFGMAISLRSANAQDGTGAHTTTYQYSQNFGPGPGGILQLGTLVTDPLGNDTVHVLTDLSGCSFYETQTNFYQGSHTSGTLLKSVKTDYQSQTNPFAADVSQPGVFNVFPTRKTVTWANGQTSKVETDYDTKFASGTAAYSFGNAIAIREYDYGVTSGSPGPLRRTTTNTYLPFTNSAYLSANLLHLLSSSTITDGNGVQVSQTTYSYDGSTLQTSGISTQHDTTLPNPGIRGNLTSVCRWLNTTNGNLCTTSTFYDTGTPFQVTDPNNNKTTYSYSSTYAGAYVTQTSLPDTGAVHHTASGTYDFNTGKLLTLVDQNSATSTYVYDPFGRMLSAAFPDTGATTFVYNDSALASSAEQKRAISSGVQTDFLTSFDGLGRTFQTSLNSDPDGVDFTDTTYDALGRTATVSNPHRSTASSTDGITTTIYDALNRVCLVVPPDGTLPAGGTCPATQPANTIFTTYSGNTTTVTDQTGHNRKSVTDALGRLTQVFEDPAGQNLETDYSYDALGNLLTVTQKGGSADPTQWRTRTFTYDSLSRLLTATNPESGTITYAYDADGNLVNKTSPAPNQTGTATVTLTYCYDALNRLTAKGASFSPNPPQSCSSGTLSAPIATYSYDQPGCLLNTTCANIGHRTGMVDAAGAESWSYDVMGRPTTVQRTTNGFTRNFLYAYNFDGSLASLTYPSYSPLDAWPTRTETMFFTQGGAGRPLSEESSSTAAAYNAHYEPNGSLCFMNSDWGNLFTHTYTFNNRLQPSTVQVYGTGHGPTTPCTASTDTTADLDLTYTYTDANGHNNGNVMQIEDNVEWSRTQDFAYDSLNRISAAWTWGSPTNGAADCWAEQYGYDPWGNLLSIAGIAPAYTGCSQESGFNVTVTAKNQVSNNVYDAAGNLISIPGVASYTYDAENHLLTAGGVTYTYDGDGQRLVKSSGTTYWYGAGSDPLFETDSGGYQIYLHYYFNGQRIGRREAWAEGFWVDHYAYDALGNARFVYSFDGIDDESVYYPFGGERVISSGGHNQFKFTGKERDSESSLDNFGARYMGSSVGRFTSPDPLLASASPYNPQTWNRYAYGLNNPLRIIDPTGLWDWDQSAGGDASDEELQDQANDKDLSRKERNQAKDELAFRQRFRDALDAANEAAGSSTLSDDQQSAAQAGVNAYGSEKDGNGVTVGEKSGYGSTTLLNNDDTISVKFGSSVKGDFLTATVAHEGTHVDQAQTWLIGGEGSIGDINHYAREQAAWTVGASIAQALGMKSYAPHGGGSEYQAWNRGWKTADVQTLRSKGIGNILTYSNLKPTDTDTYSNEHHQ